LRFNPSERYSSAFQLKSDLEEEFKENRKARIFRNFYRPFLSIGLAGAIVVAGMLNYATYEPKKLDMPTIHRSRGLLYSPLKHDKSPSLEFEAEDIEDLPEAKEQGLMGAGGIQNAKRCSDNRIVAYLAKAHWQALNVCAGNPYSQNQYDLFMGFTTPDERRIILQQQGPVWPIWAKSIEVALNKSKLPNGKIDLEDAVVYARCGEEKLRFAQRCSNSPDYKVYRDAKFPEGSPVFSAEERRFVDIWLSYIHADIDR